MFIKTPHRQEIFFDNGSMRVLDHVVKIEQGKWFHIMTESGVEHIINPDKVLFVRVSPAKITKQEHARTRMDTKKKAA